MESRKTGATEQAATQHGPAVEPTQSGAQPTSQAVEVFHRGVGQGGVVQVTWKGSTGLNSGAYAGTHSTCNQARCCCTASATRRLRWAGQRPTSLEI